MSASASPVERTECEHAWERRGGELVPEVMYCPKCHTERFPDQYPPAFPVERTEGDT